MPTLLDHLGRPVSPRTLVRESARPTLTGVRTPFRDPVATTLTPQKLSSILRDAAKGNGAAFLSLAQEMETRDLHYRSALTQRKAVVASLPVSVTGDGPAAEAVRDVVDGWGFRHLLLDLLDALGKGFSMVEVVWETSESQWRPRFVRRDPGHFQLDPLGEHFRLRDDDEEAGLLLEPFKWIEHRPPLLSAHPLMAGLARPVSVYHLFKSLGLRDWVMHAEVFGMPVRVGTYPEGTSEDDIATLQQAVAGLGADASAVLKEGMQIEFPGAQVGARGGGDVYEKLLRWCNQEISKGVLGQTMTTEDGASLSQAEVHERVLSVIGRGDAHALAETLNRDLVRPFVDLNFGPQAVYPAVAFSITEPEDVGAWTQAAVPWVDRGLRMPLSTLQDKLGLSAGEGDGPALQRGTDGPDESAVVAHLLHRIEQGRELTEDQWRLVDLQLARRQGDEIDALVTKAVDRGWRELMEPVVAPIEQVARTSRSADEFLTRLDDQVPDLTALQKQLSKAMFIARGAGGSS